LTGCHHQLRTGALPQIADDRSFDVKGVHRRIVSRRTTKLTNEARGNFLRVAGLVQCLVRPHHPIQRTCPLRAHDPSISRTPFATGQANFQHSQSVRDLARLDQKDLNGAILRLVPSQIDSRLVRAFSTKAVKFVARFRADSVTSPADELVYRTFLPITCRSTMCGLTGRKLLLVSRIVAVSSFAVTPFLA
jgi:hypothetical protein